MKRVAIVTAFEAVSIEGEGTQSKPDLQLVPASYDVGLEGKLSEKQYGQLWQQTLMMEKNQAELAKSSKPYIQRPPIEPYSVLYVTAGRPPSL